jgi:hypothetical protein
VETLPEEVMPTKPSDRFVVYNLRETYAELGEYEFKVVLSPRYFKNGHSSEMQLVDSDGKPMRFELKKWGRKMNCVFFIDENTADGVAAARLQLQDDKGHAVPGHLTFWVIKP